MSPRFLRGNRRSFPSVVDRSEWTSRFHPATFRAALWTAVSLHRARRALHAEGLKARVPGPPPLPVGATRGVYAVIRRQPQTCLERAMVLQTWYSAHGHPLEVVVGVSKGEGGFQAHAWLEIEPAEGDGYQEIMRLPAPSVAP